MRWERFYQSPTLIIFGILALLAFAALVTLIIPTMDNVLWEPTDRARPYSAIEAQGRRIYGREGCWYCHTQQVRPVKADANLGPVSQPGDYVYDKPAYLGSERQGPDLTWVGDRLPDPEYHIIHLKNPRSTMPQSIMPSYNHLPDEDLRALAAYMVSMKSQPTPLAERQRRARGNHAHALPPEEYRIQNPILLSRESAAAGKRLYDRHCARCHVTDFTDTHYMGEASDAYLFWRISEGPEDVSGHSFQTALPTKARWQIVHYLRTFAEGAAGE